MANSERTYIVARNTGVGPALIEDVVVRYRGNEIKKDPHDFFRDVRPEAAADQGVSVDRLIPGRLVSAGEAVLMLGTEGEGASPMLGEVSLVVRSRRRAAKLVRRGRRAEVRARQSDHRDHVRSVYGERWRVTSDTAVPKPL